MVTLSNKNIVRIFDGILIVLYTVAIFLIFGLGIKEFPANFFVNYAFAIITPVFIFVKTFFNNRKYKSLEFDYYYTFAIITVCLIELILASIFMAISTMIWWVSLIVHFFVLGILSLLILYFSLGINHVKKVAESQRKDVDYMKDLKIAMQSASYSIQGEENKRDFAKLIRKTENSTYKSTPGAKETEKRLLEMASDIKKYTEEAQKDAIVEMNALLEKRNLIIDKERKDY